MKRVCLLLALCLLLTLTGCQGQTPVSPSTPPAEQPAVPPSQETVSVFTLAYSREDTLNPFTTKSEANLYLSGLLYDRLVVIGEGFLPRLSLAEKVDTPDATHLVVTLHTAMFSDGTPVTAADVVASFQQAKASPNYAALLTNVAAAAVTGSQVTFTLAAADVNALACLSFPVVKADTLTDEPARAPVGSGDYVYQTTDNGARLVAATGVEAAYGTVTLRHLPNSTAMYYALASGDLTYYYSDLDDGTLPQRTGASTAVDVNGLIFLGVNGTRDKLKTAEVRRALSFLLDRQAIAMSVYSEWGIASQQPFHPAWQGMTALQLPTAMRDLEGAIRLLDAAGCTVKDGGKRLTLELIYCTDNRDRGGVAELVRTQMEGGGITVTVTGLPEAEYRTRLEKGEYDLYLGEIRLTADMSLRPLLTEKASASFGVDAAGATAVAYAAYLAGTTTLEEFLQTFAADMPYVPLCWRRGFVAYDRLLTVVTPTGFDPYNGLAGWK